MVRAQRLETPEGLGSSVMKSLGSRLVPILAAAVVVRLGWHVPASIGLEEGILLSIGAIAIMAAAFRISRRIERSTREPSSAPRPD